MTRRLVAPVLVAIALLITAVVVSATGTSHVTPARLERSIPAVFARLYQQQEQLQGKPVLSAASLDPQAQCMRIGAGSPTNGPGGDWACLVSWQDPDVPMPPEGWGRFELNVHSNGCYTAVGPSKLVGLLTIADANGEDVNNPLGEFDACFDPDSDDTSPAVSFPAYMSVTSPSVTASDGAIRPDVLCTLGTGSCAGEVVATTENGTRLGTAHYDLGDGISGQLSFPAPSSQTTTVTLSFAPSSGRAPDAPVSVPVLRP